MITFYLSMECENCGHDIYRRCATTDTLRLGEPVIPFDLAAQTDFECPQCDAHHYTGDFEVLTEGGIDLDEDDEEAIA